MKIADNMKLYKTSDDYLLREIAGESILIPIGGAVQLNGILTLNETFTFLWKQFQEAHTIQDVVLRAEEEYESAEEVEDDICRFVEACLQYGFLKEEE